jgi:hypothetical protein
MVFNLNNRIRNNRLNLINHVQRLEPERIPKQLIDYKFSVTSPKLILER